MNLKKLVFGSVALFCVNTFATVGYHSGQQTVAAAAWWNANKVDDLYISNPGFNRAKKGPAEDIWAEMKAEKIDEPCFGPILNVAAQNMGAAGIPVELGIDAVVIGKLSKIEPLLKELQKRNLGKIADRIENFVKDIKVAKIASLQDWSNFLAEHNIAEPMTLHFDNYLNNFDLDKELTDEVIKEINNTHFINEKAEDVTISGECVRWLTKTEFKPIGCFTDVINFLKIKGELPSVLMHDAENDDIGVLGILEKAHREKGTQLRVVVQLPVDVLVNPVAEFYKEKGYEILRDPDSLNLDKLINIWKLNK